MSATNTRRPLTNLPIRAVKMAESVIDHLFDGDKKLISRAEARASGLIRYFTGVPCSREHIDERFTSTGGCLECCRENTKKRWALGLVKEDPKKRHEYYKRRMARNGEAIQARHNENRRALRAKYKSEGIKQKQYPEAKRRGYDRAMAERGDEIRRISRERRKAWRDANPEKAREMSRKSQASRRAKARDKVNATKRRWKNEQGRLRRFNKLSHDHKLVVVSYGLLGLVIPDWFTEHISILNVMYSDHMEQVKILRSKRSRGKKRSIKNGAGGNFTFDDVNKIREMQRDKCAMCRKKLSWKGELDHIQPLSRGGTNNASNLQYLCSFCNRSKGAKDPLEFSRSRGLLL